MNAVIYARYSSYGQQEQSIEGQLRDCYAYAQREGHTVIGEYIDRAISGRSDDRPDFQRMIADATSKQFQAIIVWKLDRFSRDRFDNAHYKAKLKKCGVRVISATEAISDAPEGIIMEGLLESLAEYYSANLSKHVKRGMRESAIQGKTTGGTTPLGYKNVDKRLVLNEETAPIMEYAFNEYATGTPMKEIIDELNAKGYRTSLGNPFVISSLMHALHNTKYVGYYEYEGQLIECPALVSQETFDKAQARLKANKRNAASKRAKVRYLLNDKVFCGPCGSPMIGESGRNKSNVVYNYYTCAARKKHHSCKKRNERKEFLEWYVAEQTVEYILNPDRMEYIADALIAYQDEKMKDNGEAQLAREIERLNRALDRAVEASLEIEDGAARKRYYGKITDMEVQKANLADELSRLRLSNGIRFTNESIIACLKMVCRGDPMDTAFQERIFDTFVNSVYVYDDKILIFYNLKDSKQVSYIEVCDEMEGLEIIDNQIADKSSDTNGNALPYTSNPNTQRFCLCSVRLCFER